MEISIKKIGFSRGTIGWLAHGLEAGEITIDEGVLRKNGNHGLWLHAAEIRQFLAAHNQYGLTRLEWEHADEYRVAGDEERDGIFTDAAWVALMGIAQQWCDEQNAERAGDSGAHQFTIRRVEVASA